MIRWIGLILGIAAMILSGIAAIGSILRKRKENQILTSEEAIE